MKNFPFYALLILMLWIGYIAGINFPVHTHKKVKYIVDWPNTEFYKMNGDSIYWSKKTIKRDSLSKDGTVWQWDVISPSDTVIGLKNFPGPVIVIIDKDTFFHFPGDTLRYTTCNK